MNRPDFECHHYCDTVPPAVDFHEHEFYEVFFFVSGNVTYNIEGRTYLLRTGDILLTDNQDIHRPYISPGKPYERYVLWITPDFLNFLQKYGSNLSACFTDASRKKYKLIRPDSSLAAQLKNQLDKIIANRDDKNFGSEILEVIYIVEFMVYLNRAYFDTSDIIRRDVTENKKSTESLNISMRTSHRTCRWRNWRKSVSSANHTCPISLKHIPACRSFSLLSRSGLPRRAI